MKQTSPAEFYKLVDQFMERFLAEAPVAATQLGDHRFDDRLGEHTSEARARQEKTLREASEKLQAMNTSGWDIDARIDHTLMVRLVNSFLREFTKLKDYERDPGMYVNEGIAGVFLLLIRDFAPLSERMRNVAKRLRHVPRVLEEGKKSIVPERVPRVWAEVALEGAKKSLILYRLVLPIWSLRTPHLAPKVIPVSLTAASALQDYIEFLEKTVLPNVKGDFAIGKELFEEILREDHMLDYTADDLLQLGWKLFEETKAQMEELARKIAPGKTAREILEEAKKDYPRPGEVLEVYRREMERVRKFVKEKEIVTIPEGEELKIMPTPPSMRPIIPYAAYMMPGPLENKQQGIFLVTPVERFAPRKIKEQKLRGHNYAKIPITALHEAYPGHHLQLVYANRYAKTLPRKLGSALSSPFVEGWAFYCEELMEKLGYIDQPVQKLARLQDQLWRAARIILDVSLHTKGMSVEEGVNFLVEKVGLERTNALAEVRRYTMSPTQPLSYLVGKLEILKVIEEYKKHEPGASLQEIHDAILSCGSLPPKLLKERLLAS